MTTMSDDLISRQAAIDAVKTYLGDYEISRTVQCRLRLLPSAQPERKVGKWNFDGNQMFECTNCGVAYTEYQFEKMRVRYNDPKFPKFCPNCGSYNGGDSDVKQ